MGFVLFVLAISVGVTVVSVCSQLRYNKGLRTKIHLSFGHIPDNEDIDFNSISSYADCMEKDDLRIDQITWRDLDMDSVYKRINTCQSFVGDEYMYNVLHELKIEQDVLLRRESMMRFFDDNPESRFDVQYALARLGKDGNNGIATMMFNANRKLLRWASAYNILAIMPLIFIATMFINQVVGVVGFCLIFAVNLAVHYMSIKALDNEMTTIDHFSSMVKCCARLYKIEALSKLPVMVELKEPYKVFKNSISKSPHRGLSSGNGFLWTYINIAFLFDVRSYNKFMALITQHNQEFQSVYKAIGEIDVAISVLSFRKSVPAYCTPIFHSDSTLDFEEVYHPLIQAPISNSHRISTDCLITGSNASGKSTFIKSLAVNGILAQTIYTCTAKKFATRLTMIVTSMAMRDNLLGGESYFIVEIKSLKRVMNLVAKHPCICYFDEILRGTNTPERIAASTAILKHLNKQDCLCIVASHDIELAHLLNYDNYHFSERITDSDIVFDYTLKQGPSTTRNAIKLLELLGFEAEVVAHASELIVSRNTITG